MRVAVDAPHCIASGQCVLIAPDVFDQDDDGTVVLLADEVPSGGEQVVEEAANVCPARIITLLET